MSDPLKDALQSYTNSTTMPVERIRRKWTPATAVTAVEAVCAGGISVRQACVIFNMPRQTLTRYIKLRKKGKKIRHHMWYSKTVFTPTQESLLLSQILEKKMTFSGVGFRMLAYELARRSGNGHRFKTKTGMAGHDWLQAFCRRHPQLKLVRYNASINNEDMVKTFFESFDVQRFSALGDFEDELHEAPKEEEIPDDESDTGDSELEEIITPSTSGIQKQFTPTTSVQQSSSGKVPLVSELTIGPTEVLDIKPELDAITYLEPAAASHTEPSVEERMCNFCYQGFTEDTGDGKQDLEDQRAMIEFVLSVPLDSDDTLCCKSCKAIFQSFFDFKHNCLIAIGKHQDLQMSMMDGEDDDADAIPKDQFSDSASSAFDEQMFSADDFSYRSEHTPIQQPKTESKGFDCAKCGRSFISSGRLAWHQRVCDDPSATKKQCPQCPAFFKNSVLLRYHLNRHKGERPYRCRIGGCTKAFFGTDSRYVHEKFCASTFRLICRICGVSLKTVGSFRVHLHKMHNSRPTPEQRLYACNTCDKRFDSNEQIKEHLATAHPSGSLVKNELKDNDEITISDDDEVIEEDDDIIAMDSEQYA